MNQTNQMNLGRQKLEWSPEVWTRIDQAVHDEAKRTKVAAKFLPLYMAMPGAFIVPADTTTVVQPLTIDEAAITPLVEILVEFALTPQQYEREPAIMTAVTLATRATNLLSQAEDLLLFQGNQGLKDDVFKKNQVRHQSGDSGKGLLNVAKQIIDVPPLTAGVKKWGELTFEKVAEGYAALQNNGHYGPYALVLHTIPYADTYAPLASTLIMPADRIKPLVTAGFYGTGTLSDLTGVLVSLGGNTMDLVVGMDTITAFMQEDPQGRYLFRVYERFALRLKDESAVIRFNFNV